MIIFNVNFVDFIKFSFFLKIKMININIINIFTNIIILIRS